MHHRPPTIWQENSFVKPSGPAKFSWAPCRPGRPGTMASEKTRKPPGSEANADRWKSEAMRCRSEPQAKCGQAWPSRSFRFLDFLGPRTRDSHGAHDKGWCRQWHEFGCIDFALWVETWDVEIKRKNLFKVSIGINKIELCLYRQTTSKDQRIRVIFKKLVSKLNPPVEYWHQRM